MKASKVEYLIKTEGAVYKTINGERHLVDPNTGNIYDWWALQWIESKKFIDSTHKHQWHIEMGIYTSEQECYEARIKKMQEHPDRYYTMFQANSDRKGVSDGY